MEKRLILDRYRPLAELGEGGHGSVVLAYDTRMARRVAIKRLPLPLDDAGKPISRAGLAEARTAALLNHPNIVTVHEWDTDADEAFLIMEHVDGLSLGDLMDEPGGRLDPDGAAVVAEDVGRALTFAHANGVLHLDIKPDNVIVTREGVVKVADFGIAQLTDIDGSAPGTSGTLGYMPPEQLADEVVDERTDEWAFAALLYRVLTGREPFDSRRIETALLAETLEPPRPPSASVPGLDPALDDILLDALTPHPQERFESVTDLVDALAPLLGDPGAGRASLAGLVRELTSDEDEDEPLGPLGLWDRLIAEGAALRRVGAAIAGLWLAGTSLDLLGLGGAATLGGALLVALAGALAPGLGVALALLAAVSAVWALAGPLTGIAALVAASAFWWFLGREGRGTVVVPLTAPLFAVASTGMAPPLVLGYAFGPLPAAASAALAGLAVMTAAAASGASAPYLDVPLSFLARPWDASAIDALRTLATTPAAYVAVLGWAAAGGMCSVVSARATRAAGAAGVAAGFGWLSVAYLAWSVIDPSLAFPGAALVRHAAGSLILMALVVAAGPPARAEEG